MVGTFNQKINGLEYTIKPESATISGYRTTVISGLR